MTQTQNLPRASVRRSGNSIASPQRTGLPSRPSLSSRAVSPSATPQQPVAAPGRQANPAIRAIASGQTIPFPRSPQRAMVELLEVCKSYGPDISVLNRISFRVNPREFVFITGASGAGKSTLLRLLYGAERATSGDVAVAGVNVSQVRSRSLAMLRRRIGVVFQDYKLLPNRTVAENVAFVLRAQGLSRAEVKRRLSPALKMVGLLDKADRFPSELSGGEQQRASLARAIVNTPPLLLADEPTGNLDPENSVLVLQILERLNSFGVTIVMTTHDRTLLDRASHRRVHIENGNLIEM